MNRSDRLSALLSRFEMSVTPAPCDESNLVFVESSEAGLDGKIVLQLIGPIECDRAAGETITFSARVEWGGQDNPLIAALPPRVEVELNNDPELQGLASLLKAESVTPRCGSETVLDRLGEVLMVRLLRAEIERGQTSSGLLGGLADPRLSRTIVAMHEHPGQAWRNEDLAQIAGLSISRFSELFTKIVAVSPMVYLRHWRMILARQDAERGDRIQTIARRYGYGSTEALSRAFRKEYDTPPIELRRRMTG